MSELCIFSCSLDHNFSSTHSIFIILGFLEVERYQGENEIDHDTPGHSTVIYISSALASHSAGYVYDCTVSWPKAPTRPAPAISFFLIAEFRFFWLCSLENITSEAPAKLSKSARRKVPNSGYSSRTAHFSKWKIAAQLTNDLSQETLLAARRKLFQRTAESFLFDVDIWIVGFERDLTELQSVEVLHSCQIDRGPYQKCPKTLLVWNIWGVSGQRETPPAYAPAIGLPCGYPT